MTQKRPTSGMAHSGKITPPPLHACFNPKPRTWWRWLNGNISRDGITRDLEAIAGAGFCGVTLFNLGAFHPEGDVRFMSPEWQEMFTFAIEECARLGLDFSFKHCDGWGASGGPWIEPEDSMKWLVNRKLTVDGGRTIDINVPQPYTQCDFYHDVAVVAYPAFAASALPFQPAEIQVSTPGWLDNSTCLFDGDLHTCAMFGFKDGQPHYLDFTLPQVTELAAIRLFHGSRESVVGPMHCRLLQSADGETYTPVAI